MKKKKSSQRKVVSEADVRAFAEGFCCERCAYREAGRESECDAVKGNPAFDARIRRALEAMFKKRAKL